VRRRAAPTPRRARALAAVLAFTACASPTPGALLDARSAYDRAEQSPDVTRYAPVELYEAQRALERAEAEWTREEDEAETEHLSYLAHRRVEIATEWSKGRRAVERAEALTRERERVLLEVRTSEADMAKAVAEAARADAEARAREAEDARRAAEEAEARERKLREELADLQARETERGLMLTLGDVLFDLDRATLKPGSMQRLFRLVTFLRDYPTRAVLVEGHTDSTGSDDYNLSLSERRAEAVQGFLVENGVAPSRVLARGYGKGYPIASNDSPGGRQLNRRVEIVILDPGERLEDEVRPPAPQ
jgi:outer membrane protein OmpA-like peptidoglycan-associated protein